MADHMALWAAEQEIERLRQAQEALSRQLSRLARAVHRGMWREMDATTDVVAWPSVEARLDLWVQLEVLCASARLAQGVDGAGADYRLRASYIDGFGGELPPKRK
jgi:hypothetical protein